MQTTMETNYPVAPTVEPHYYSKCYCRSCGGFIGRLGICEDCGEEYLEDD